MTTAIGYLAGLALAGAVVEIIPGDQGFFVDLLLGAGCSALGALIGRAAR
jgi:hypothetical protein